MENILLSKIINDKDFSIVRKANITASDFYTDKDTFMFIDKYVKTYGEVPSYQTVVAECEDFDYVPETVDNVKYLVKTLKNNTAKRKAFELLQQEATKRFSTMQGTDFVKWLAEESNNLRNLVEVDNLSGTNYATNGAERKQDYLNRKDNRTNIYIPTPYDTLTEYLSGGFELGDYVLVQAFTNKGKSWLSSDIGITAWRSGFGVLHYSPELSKSQQLSRLDTLDGHFMNCYLRTGQLTNEEQYFKYLDTFNDSNEVPYLVKTMEDMNKGLSLSLIEADLQSHVNIKMVIIDGFNLMNHRSNGGNRDSMTLTSRKLRQLFGKYGVVGIVVHQANTSSEKEKGSDELGNRIVTPPAITAYSETSAVIQDSATILSFDQIDGVGKILLAKSRVGNVGKEIELQCDFNRGYIKEVTSVDFI